MIPAPVTSLNKPDKRCSPCLKEPATTAGKDSPLPTGLKDAEGGSLTTLDLIVKVGETTVGTLWLLVMIAIAPEVTRVSGILEEERGDARGLLLRALGAHLKSLLGTTSTAIITPRENKVEILCVKDVEEEQKNICKKGNKGEKKVRKSEEN